MQRERGRPNRQSRGGRGGARGGNKNGNLPCPSRPRPAYTSVPPIRVIQPGGGVSIILKEDQQSGHQVKGIVADLLTRGDHPRGVKVRLRDGRVGRVQGLVSEAEGLQGEGIVGGPEANLGRNGEGAVSAGGGRRRGGRIERDVRDEDEYLYENRDTKQDYGLFAALEEADRKHESSKIAPATQLFQPQEIAVCPVCYTFEGDEASVAHHVEQHFAE
ncbi:MFS multidrug transporter [Stagonosporopsis vannaccii]|nr:MFS multidrug transporter [Stagonosporopsis vannaccii]